MSEFNPLDKILSDFKVPRRKLELDKPYDSSEINKDINTTIMDVLNNDYLEFTRNLKIAKVDKLTTDNKEEMKKSIENHVNDAYNFEYENPSSKKTDYDLLKEGYEKLYAVYIEQKYLLHYAMNDLMKLSHINKTTQDAFNKKLDDLKITDNITKEQLDKFKTDITAINESYLNRLDSLVNSTDLSNAKKKKILEDLRKPVERKPLERTPVTNEPNQIRVVTIPTDNAVTPLSDNGMFGSVIGLKLF
jgi:hypothetical protein